MSKISRRELSSALAGGLAVAGLSVKAPAVWAQSNMPKIKAAFPPVLDATIFHVGAAKGMFAAERVEVELIPSPGGVATMSAIWIIAVVAVGFLVLKFLVKPLFKIVAIAALVVIAWVLLHGSF